MDFIVAFLPRSRQWMAGNLATLGPSHDDLWGGSNRKWVTRIAQQRDRAMTALGAISA
jgi:hypothetical protein